MDRKFKQTYIMFSVDTEHDTIKNHSTRTAGWSNGIPLLCETFDILGMRGKVCWLIEYNVKEGLPAGNPNSVFFVKEFPELITQIKNRGDELGVHPAMVDWVGKEKTPVASYNDSDAWDMERSYYDPNFVMNVIISAVREIKAVSGVNPIGCRTAAFHYATHLAKALQKNGICVDSSILKKSKQFVTAPNAYYAHEDDIRRKSTSGNGVLEIPAVSCAQFDLNKPLTRIRIEYLIWVRKPVFLSLYIHNWDAITANGVKNEYFLKNLTSFMNFLRQRKVYFLSWIEAKETFDAIYGTK
jgi:hypothetical protein